MAHKKQNSPKKVGAFRLFIQRFSLLGMLSAVCVLGYLGVQDYEARKHLSPEESPYGAQKMPTEDGTVESNGENIPPETSLEERIEAPSLPAENLENSEVADFQDTDSQDTDSQDTDLPTNLSEPPAWNPDSPEVSPTPESTSLPNLDETPENLPTPAPIPAPTPALTPAPTPAPTPATTPIPVSEANIPPGTPPLAEGISTAPAEHPLKGVAGPPVQNFLEVFDFSTITPDWVSERWSHIISVGPLHTRGYRVPLCTGVDKSDITGTLTYYFDRNLDLEKITFEGFAGDLERLILTLQFFQMGKRMTSDPNMLLYESPAHKDGKTSYMRSYHRTTPLGENPNQKFWITMELYPKE